MQGEALDRWNNMHPLVTPVEILSSRVRISTGTTTLSRAFRSRRGKNLIWLNGFSYPVNLKRVKAL